MKRYLKYTCLLFALLAVSCKGYLDEADLSLAAVGGRTEIAADGADAVSFLVKARGEDVTGDAVIADKATGEVVGGAAFSTVEPGVYTFTASYDGLVSYDLVVTAAAVPLTVTADRRGIADGETATFIVKLGSSDVSVHPLLRIRNATTGEYLVRDGDGRYRYTRTGDGSALFAAELGGNRSAVPVKIGPRIFYKKVGILEFTGTWCVNCPSMIDALKGVEEVYPERNVMVGVHYDDLLATAYGTELTRNVFRLNLLPSLVMDLTDKLTRVEPASVIAERLERLAGEHEAQCGIAVSSSVAGTTATVEVRLFSNETREYGIAVALVESGITGYPQLTPAGYRNDYRHDHTLRKFHGDNVYGASTGTVGEGTEYSKTFTFDVTGFAAANCGVAVFAVATEGSTRYVMNAAECALGGTLDYRYE